MSIINKILSTFKKENKTSFFYHFGSIIDITGSYYQTPKPKTNEEAFYLDSLNIQNDFKKFTL